MAARDAGSSTLLRRAAPWLALLVLSILFRLPSLANAAYTNSDAAICGLQAMHILKGEWRWFLYGSGYQTSIDSLVAAGFFAVLGPTGFALMLSTFAGHVALTALAFATLRRHAPVGLAFALTLLLVFTGGPIHTYVLYPPRQASLTIAFAAIWIVDGASRAKGGAGIARAAIGAALASLAVFADPYALLFVPGVVVLGLLAARDGDAPRSVALRRAAATLVGTFVGLVPYWLLRHSSGASLGQTSLGLEPLARNFTNLVESSGPWALGTKVYVAEPHKGYVPWETPAFLHAFQVLAATLFVGLVLSGGVLLFTKKLPWEARRLGAFGALMLPLNLGGFLLSPMVMDHFSSRYLVAFLLVAPFALLPIALRAPREAALLLAPYLATSALSGWASYKPFVDGIGIELEPGRLRDDRALGAALRERGVKYAEADYWASYRLTLLWAEAPIVVPTNPAEDRYAPYRDAWQGAEKRAYIFDANRSRERLEEVERSIREGKGDVDTDAEKIVLGDFTVFVGRRNVPVP